MNRKTFFKTLLGGAAVAVIAPQILAEKKEDVLAVDVATIPMWIPLSEVADEYKRTGGFPLGVYYRTMDEYMRAMGKRRDAIITYYEG